MNEKSKNSKACVGIAALIGGISVGIVTLIALFSPEQISIAAWIVAPLCLMGTALGYMATERAGS